MSKILRTKSFAIRGKYGEKEGHTSLPCNFDSPFILPTLQFSVSCYMSIHRVSNHNAFFIGTQNDINTFIEELYDEDERFKFFAETPTQLRNDVIRVVYSYFPRVTTCCRGTTQPDHRYTRKKFLEQAK